MMASKPKKTKGKARQTVEIEEIDELEAGSKPMPMGMPGMPLPAVAVAEPKKEVEEVEVEEIAATTPGVVDVEEDDEVIVVESTAPGQTAATAPTWAADSPQNMQLAMSNEMNASNLQQHFADRVQGSRREEDDSTIAFGEKVAEKFGWPETMPMPSAPPLTQDAVEAQSRWARATQTERRAHPDNKKLEVFFKNNGIEERKYEPSIVQEEIPKDATSTKFSDNMADARDKGAAEGSEAIGDAKYSLLFGTPSPKNYASFGDVYLPPEYLALHNENRLAAEKALIEDDQFDHVQILANETARMYKSSWVFGERVAGGTLEIRMNAERSKMVLLGEGYKARNLDPGWTTLARGIPKDTEYWHSPNEFTVVRINPGHLGICQKTGSNRKIMRLLPGRYVLQERLVRYIGVAKILPLVPVQFTPHANSNDPDIGRLARRFSSYYLPVGHRLFVSSREGVFKLDPDVQKRPFLFDAKALETPLNAVNPRDYVQSSEDGKYHIVKLQKGEWVIVRPPQGNDVMIEYKEGASDDDNTYHLSKTFYDFNGKVYSRADKIVRGEGLTSVRLSPNDILVVKDADGNIRFLTEFNPQKTVVVRKPWAVLDLISKAQNEYVYPPRTNGKLLVDNYNDTMVARVKPASNQWPIIYDVNAGVVRFMPHSVEYIFSSTEQQIYVGMADQNCKEPQKFDVPRVGVVTVAIIASGQLGMCKLNNMSFFLPPSPEPYLFRPPNEFYGMVDMENTHVHIPGSDLHRIYIPAGQWAVAMVDGRQTVLDPAISGSGAQSTDKGNGIWIFRAQQLELAGPTNIDEKYSELFNVTRLQVPMNEIAFGVDSKSGERLIWTAGNHTINKNSGQVFQGFFKTQLDDVKIDHFNVVWNGGVRSTVDASVGFHIQKETTDGRIDIDMMKRVLNLCQDHNDLHAKVVENTKHQLFDVIAQIEPLGYGSTLSNEDADLSESSSKISRRKETTLQDLEKMFSDHVDTILKKYGIVVDNVTITKIDLDPSFIKQSEEIQKARMEARKKVLVAEQDMQRQQIAQQLRLQEEQAKMAQERVAYEASLKQKEVEASSKIELEKLRLQELEAKGESIKVEMETRKATALLEAETKAVEASATARAEAQARKDVAQLMLDATKFEVEAQKLKAEGDRQTGLASVAVDLNKEYGGLEKDPNLLLDLLKMRVAVDGQRAIAEATARCTDPAISRMIGRLDTFEDIVPQMTRMGQGAGLLGSLVMPDRPQMQTAAGNAQVQHNAK